MNGIAAGEHGRQAGLRLASLTAEQAHRVEALTSHPDEVIVARFRLEPGSRPTLYVRDPLRLPQPRGSQSVAYIDALISNYLLHPDYFHLHAERFPADDRELVCIVQIADCPDDIGMGVGFCARDPRITLLPDVHFWVQRGYFAEREQFRKVPVAWQNRAKKAFWRGSSTGANAQMLETFQALPRFRLCTLSTTISGLRHLVDAKLTDIVQARNPAEGEKIRALTEALDILVPPVPQTEFLNYRYLIDIDGNSNSWGFLLKLLMGSCVLKVASEWRQWYYDDLRPLEHYVPVKSDLSDLEEQIGWCLDNEVAAREIAANGTRYASGIVFGSEMPRAATRLLEASHPTLDNFALRTIPIITAAHNATDVSRQLNDQGIWSNSAMPDIDFSNDSVKALFDEFRDGDRNIFGPYVPPEAGAFDGSAPDTIAEMASLLYSVRTAGNRYRALSLGAAPGEWAIRAERAFGMVCPDGDYKSFNLEADIGHFETITKFLADNHADPNRNVVLYKAIAEEDGWAYFPVINSAVDWGAGIAAVSDNPDDLDSKIRLSERGRQDRMAANGGRPLEFRKVPAVSLSSLLEEIGPVDFLHSDIQGAEADVFPYHTKALSGRVRICCISTHGPEIERKLLDCFAVADWQLACAFPCGVEEGICLRDGIFVWINPRITPSATADDVPRAGDRVAKSAVVPSSLAPHDLAEIREEEWIRSLYKVLLLREPDPDGFAQYLRGLRAGTGIEHVIRSFLSSGEFVWKQKFLSASIAPQPSEDTAHGETAANRVSANWLATARGEVVSPAASARTVNVAFMVDDNYTTPFCTAVLSLALSTGSDCHVHVVSSQSEDLREKTDRFLARLDIRYTLVPACDSDFMTLRNEQVIHGNITNAAYLKLFLADIFPDIPRVIYIDSDMIIRKDLKALWEVGLEGNILAAVPDPSFLSEPQFLEKFGGRYFNAGLLLLDLDRWRRDSITTSVVENIQKYETNGWARQYWDQSPLNLALDGRWKPLHPTWNTSIRTAPGHAGAYGLENEEMEHVLRDPNIFHFIGAEKPWKEEFRDVNKFFTEYATLERFVANMFRPERQATVTGPDTSSNLRIPGAHERLDDTIVEFGTAPAMAECETPAPNPSFPEGDYVSPGLARIQLDDTFPNMIRGDVAACGWQYLRRDVPHNWYVDRHRPDIGFVSRDEAHILYNTALRYRGMQALEIGCWLGWSTCHLAAGGVELDVIDPLLADPEHHASVLGALQRAHLASHVRLLPGGSPGKMFDVAGQERRRWSLIFIDGNHDRPHPLLDAKAGALVAADDALILFHDLASPEVSEGLDFLRDAGWNAVVYQTMQIMGAAWRGRARPISHIPDPSVAWSLPEHLRGYSVSGTGRTGGVRPEG